MPKIIIEVDIPDDKQVDDLHCVIRKDYGFLHDWEVPYRRLDKGPGGEDNKDRGG